jgi:hypothetical protein
VAAGGERPFGPVTKLFEQAFLTSTEPIEWTYDVAPDGRFLMIEPTAATRSAEAVIVVIQNFGEEIKRLMAAR